MTPGELIEVVVEKDVYRGLGLGHHDGRVVFVFRALAGDRVRARVETVERGFARASVEAVISPSPRRRETPCLVAEQCGGCAYQHVRHESQPGLKVAILRETFARAGLRLGEDVPVTAGPEREWRTRATLHFDVVEGKLHLGFRREGSHDVVETHGCLQISARLRSAAGRLGDEFLHRPALWPHLTALELHESSDGSAIVAVVVGDLHRSEMTDVARQVRSDWGLTGLALRGTRRAAELTLLVGSPYVVHEVLGHDYRVHASSFFQGNRFLVGPLVEAVRRAVPEGADVVELFAGAGLFAAALAPRASRIRAVEVASPAVADFRFNLRQQANASITEADAQVGLAALRPGHQEQVILDPPRAGVGRGLVESIAARGPAGIVYVSCDPTTLARDVVGFRKAGYELAEVQVFDLFPDTFHLETLVLLKPA